MVDLPAPVGPTKATDSPGAISRLTCFKTGSSGRYPKLTSSNVMRPSIVGRTVGVGKLVHRRRRVEEFAQSDDRRASLLEGRVLLDEQLDRREESVEVQEEDDELGHVELVVEDHVAPDAEQHRLAQDADHERRGTVDRVDPSGVGVGVAIGTDDVAVVADVATLAIVGRHDPNAVERLREVGEHDRDAVTREEIALFRGVVVPDGEDEEQRHDDEHGPGREFDVGQEQDDRDHDHREALEGELADAVLDELLKVLDVARHATHEDAGLLFGEEVETEPLELGEDPDTEIVHDPRGELAGDVDLFALEVDADERRARDTAAHRPR